MLLYAAIQVREKGARILLDLNAEWAFPRLCLDRKRSESTLLAAQSTCCDLICDALFL